MRRRMFPHTVTVYNVQRDVGEEYEETIVNHMTVLEGVFLDETKGVNVRESGLTSADEVTLYIPMDVDARDAITGEPKRFAGAMEFTGAEDKSGLWSLTLDGRGDDSFFVKGVVVEPDMEFGAIAMKYDGVYNITKIDEKDYGGRMAHWEVGGA